MGKIKVAIVGAGNCFSSLYQGLEYYKDSNGESIPGIMFADIGGYRPSDIEVVAVFDVDKRKVGQPTGTAIFDYSHAAKLQLTGKDAPGFIHNISTNDIKGLPLGAGCETYFCDARAKALFAAWVYHIRLANSQNAIWLETTPGRGAALLKYLDRFLIAEAVEMADVTNDFTQMHLAGPMAKSVIESALGDEIPDLPEFGHMERTFGSNATCSIRRRDILGVLGYDLVCVPERAEGVWRMLTAAGAKPAGLETYEVLRIEARMADY